MIDTVLRRERGRSVVVAIFGYQLVWRGQTTWSTCMVLGCPRCDRDDNQWYYHDRCIHQCKTKTPLRDRPMNSKRLARISEWVMGSDGNITYLHSQVTPTTAGSRFNDLLNSLLNLTEFTRHRWAEFYASEVPETSQFRLSIACHGWNPIGLDCSRRKRKLTKGKFWHESCHTVDKSSHLE